MLLHTAGSSEAENRGPGNKDHSGSEFTVAASGGLNLPTQRLTQTK